MLLAQLPPAVLSLFLGRLSIDSLTRLVVLSGDKPLLFQCGPLGAVTHVLVNHYGALFALLRPGCSLLSNYTNLTHLHIGCTPGARSPRKMGDLTSNLPRNLIELRVSEWGSKSFKRSTTRADFWITRTPT